MQKEITTSLVPDITTHKQPWSPKSKKTQPSFLHGMTTLRSSLLPSPFASDLSFYLSLRVFFSCICIHHLFLGSLVLFALTCSLISQFRIGSCNGNGRLLADYA